MQTSDFLKMNLQEQKDNVNTDVITGNFKIIDKKFQEHSELFSGLLKAHIGTYDGNGDEERVIELGFEPDAVIVHPINSMFEFYDAFSTAEYMYGAVTVKGVSAAISADYPDYIKLEITKVGYKIYNKEYYKSSNFTKASYLNKSGVKYMYIAFER